jgi:hypothetical protein
MKHILSFILLSTTLFINTVDAKTMSFTNSQAEHLTKVASVHYWNRKSDSKLHITFKTKQNIQCDRRNKNTRATCSVQVSNHQEVFSSCKIRTRSNGTKYRFCFITNTIMF